MSESIIPQINFQPWRQQKRQEAMQQFAVYAVLVVAVAGFIVFIFGSVADISVEAQKARNNQISSQTRILDKQLSSISNLHTAREAMLERMKIIKGLQGNRPVSVRIYDEIVRVLPDSVFFESLSMEGNQLFVNGISESTNEVSEFMRRIDGSEWFTSPNLSDIKSNKAYGPSAKSFVLSFFVAQGLSPEEDQL